MASATWRARTALPREPSCRTVLRYGDTLVVWASWSRDGSPEPAVVEPPGFGVGVGIGVGFGVGLGAGGAGTSLAHVALSSTPVTGTLCARCQVSRAARVEAPKAPSALIFSATWATFTLLLLWPGQTSAYADLGAVGGVAQCAVRRAV